MQEAGPGEGLIEPEEAGGEEPAVPGLGCHLYEMGRTGLCPSLEVSSVGILFCKSVGPASEWYQLRSPG